MNKPIKGNFEVLFDLSSSIEFIYFCFFRIERSLVDLLSITVSLKFQPFERINDSFTFYCLPRCDLVCVAVS